MDDKFQERLAILAEDKRIKAELAKSEPYLENSRGVLDEWELGLKKDASRYKSTTRYRDMYEPNLNYDS